MAIQKAVRIITWGIADGTSNSFTLKLAQDQDPYWVGQAQPGGVGGRIMNWLADRTTAPAPVGALLISGADSISFNKPNLIITINVPVKPAGARYTVAMDILFP